MHLLVESGIDASFSTDRVEAYIDFPDSVSFYEANSAFSFDNKLISVGTVLETTESIEKCAIVRMQCGVSNIEAATHLLNDEFHIFQSGVNELTFRLGSSHGAGGMLFLFNVSGQLVTRERIAAHDQEVIINVPFSSSRLLFAVYSSSTGVSTQRIMLDQ